MVLNLKVAEAPTLTIVRGVERGQHMSTLGMAGGHAAGPAAGAWTAALIAGGGIFGGAMVGLVCMVVTMARSEVEPPNHIPIREPDA